MSKIQKQIAKGLGIEVAEVEAVKSAYAWDLCRAASLAKWCYWCKYLTEAEMWEVLNQVSAIAKEQGKNWQEYTISFLLGRTIQGFDLEEFIILYNNNTIDKLDPIAEEIVKKIKKYYVNSQS